jgi:SAM-dependent methyltransferase
MPYFPSVWDPREGATCTYCGSSVRKRGIIHHLSECLFGSSIALPDFPYSPEIVGLGLSDWEGYATYLEQKFSYTNTFFDEEPFLDITKVPPERSETCDFLISTEVFEHVPPPVARAFAGSFKLLKPGGLLVLTVPFTNVPETVEHFPELDLFKIVQLGDSYVLVNRTADGRFELHTDLTFHIGPGSTLEMRIFSRADTVRLLEEAGFVDVRVHEEAVPQWGIYPPHAWGLPITALKPRTR